jgi:hypothetical protein
MQAVSSEPGREELLTNVGRIPTAPVVGVHDVADLALAVSTAPDVQFTGTDDPFVGMLSEPNPSGALIFGKLPGGDRSDDELLRLAG